MYLKFCCLFVLGGWLAGGHGDGELFIQAETDANQKLAGWLKPHSNAKIEIRPIIHSPPPAMFFVFSVRLAYLERGLLRHEELALIELHALKKQYRGKSEGIIDHIVTEAFYGHHGVTAFLSRAPQMAGPIAHHREKESILQSLRLQDVTEHLPNARFLNRTPERNRVYQAVIDWLNHQSGRGLRILSTSAALGEHKAISRNGGFVEKIEIDTTDTFVSLRLVFAAGDPRLILREEAFLTFVNSVHEYVKNSTYRRRLFGLDRIEWSAPRNTDQLVEVEFRSRANVPYPRLLPSSTGKIVMEVPSEVSIISGMYCFAFLDHLFSAGQWYRMSDLSPAFHFIREGAATTSRLNLRWSRIEIWEFPYDTKARRLLKVFPRTQRDFFVLDQSVSCASSLTLQRNYGPTQK